MKDKIVTNNNVTKQKSKKVPSETNLIKNRNVKSKKSLDGHPLLRNKIQVAANSILVNRSSITDTLISSVTGRQNVACTKDNMITSDNDAVTAIIIEQKSNIENTEPKIKTSITSDCVIKSAVVTNKKPTSSLAPSGKSCRGFELIDVLNDRCKSDIKLCSDLNKKVANVDIKSKKISNVAIQTTVPHFSNTLISVSDRKSAIILEDKLTTSSIITKGCDNEPRHALIINSGTDNNPITQSNKLGSHHKTPNCQDTITKVTHNNLATCEPSITNISNEQPINSISKLKKSNNDVFYISETGRHPCRLVNLIASDTDKNGIFWYINFLDNQNNSDNPFEYEKDLIPHKLPRMPNAVIDLIASILSHHDCHNLPKNIYTDFVNIINNTRRPKNTKRFLKTVWSYLYSGIPLPVHK